MDFRLLAILFATRLISISAQWDTLCPNARGGPYSPWNETRCPSDRATCCASGFNPSAVGCCPWPNAVCCPGSQYQCCPSGTTCNRVEGSGYDARYNCTAANGAVVINRATCKSGPPLPMSSSLKNGALREQPPRRSRPRANEHDELSLSAHGGLLFLCAQFSHPRYPVQPPPTNPLLQFFGLETAYRWV